MTQRATASQLPDGHAGAQTVRAASGPGVTPSMQQYLEIKTANPDSLLWYRMGDFYELFFEDAVVAAEALGIVLTKRGKHLDEDIPMCGVPVARADEYLQRLIRQGYRVAVCEQLEDPAEARKRGSKAVVRRDVVRLVTPGTITEDTLLDARARNFLTALFAVPGQRQGQRQGQGRSAGHVQDLGHIAIAAFELSTGEFEVGEIASEDVAGELARLLPREVLVPANAQWPETLNDALGWIGAAITPVPGPSFDSLGGEAALKDRLNVSDLGAFGAYSRSELCAVGALLRYVDLTQVGQRAVVQPPKRIGAGATLVIDAATRASLELVRNTSGGRQGSLLAAIDRTVTGAGARELAARIAAPLVSCDAINRRLDAVGLLVGHDILRSDLRAALRSAPDIARSVSRLALHRGGPRDLAAVRDGLQAGAQLAKLFAGSDASGLPDDLARIRAGLTAVPADLADNLRAALIDEPPHHKRDGGFIAKGYRDALDEARALRDDSRQVMASLEAQYASLTGVKSLKVKHNNILGYFIEVTAANAKPLLDAALSDTFRHRQTMANAVRFTTVELGEIEGRISSAGDRALALEQEIFAELAAAIAGQEEGLARLAAALAELDCIAALAELACEQNYTRPVISTDATLSIVGGRHPVVEQALAGQHGGPFIANDCVLGGSDARGYPPGFEETGRARIWLVTGPNMAGKSTFLRQAALIVLMAQIGSFVPADTAHVGLVDRLFSRVGASDELAKGRSTFMVEMVETAAILNQATERSLVILDEIGRGTATFDGLSIAWACVEHLHDRVGCRALFATHYHEITALEERLDGIANVTMDVKEFQDEIIFVHRVRPGAADRSYGIQVAKLAGLPNDVIQRAGEVLAVLEEADGAGGSGPSLDDLPLFSAARPKSAAAMREPSPLEASLDDVHPDELTPRAALDVLYKLKAMRTAG